MNTKMQEHYALLQAAEDETIAAITALYYIVSYTGRIRRARLYNQSIPRQLYAYRRHLFVLRDISDSNAHTSFRYVKAEL